MDQAEKDRLLKIETKLVNWDYPPQVIIETTSYCNMKCIHCNHRIMKRPRQHMSDELYKKIIDEIADVKPDTEVWPTFYGEALILGEKLFERLRYARDRGLTNQVLNSNGRLLDRKDWIDQILTSGLKRFLLSLDGFTTETFEKIRVGGKRDRIYAAVEKLLKRKKELGLDYPVIQCQFSVMKENEHEVGRFREYWEERNAEVKVRNMLSWTNSGDVVASNLDYNTDFRTACAWANSTAAIHANGNLVTCAADYEGGFIAGNVEDQTIGEIWNGPHYEKVRKVHREHRWHEIPGICKKCPDWQAVGAVYHENKRVGVKEGARPFWDGL
ncbi:MAG: radical SAM protein [Chloroflexi bacterium]|nr:radical SAM protein [Chloroflexota bacterium]